MPSRTRGLGTKDTPQNIPKHSDIFISPLFYLHCRNLKCFTTRWMNLKLPPWWRYCGPARVWASLIASWPVPLQQMPRAEWIITRPTPLECWCLPWDIREFVHDQVYKKRCWQSCKVDQTLIQIPCCWLSMYLWLSLSRCIHVYCGIVMPKWMMRSSNKNWMGFPSTPIPSNGVRQPSSLRTYDFMIQAPRPPEVRVSKRPFFRNRWWFFQIFHQIPW